MKGENKKSSKNIGLAVALLRQGLTHKEASKRLGMHPTSFSKVVNGQLELNEIRKHQLAALVGKRHWELFPEGGQDR